MTRRAIVSAGALACVVVLAMASLLDGPIEVRPGDLLAALVGNGPPLAETVLSLRGPRVLAALIVGAGLAAAGAVFQAVFRNPLVAPDLLGVSSGAGLGAAAALLLGLSFAFVQGGAFLGGLAAVAIAVGTSRMAGEGAEPTLGLVLCGIVTGALASAGLALLLHLADPYAQLPAITYWLLGSLARASGAETLVALLPAGAGLLIALALGSRLDALGLGDEQARALGLNAGRARLLVVTAATAMTAAAVSIAGIVGWVGLIAPHAARLLVGSEARALVPASGLAGAAFVLAIDRVARAGETEIPLGLLAAAIGAPAFLILFVASGRRA